MPLLITTVLTLMAPACLWGFSTNLLDSGPPPPPPSLPFARMASQYPIVNSCCLDIKLNSVAVCLLYCKKAIYGIQINNDETE